MQFVLKYIYWCICTDPGIPSISSRLSISANNIHPRTIILALPYLTVTKFCFQNSSLGFLHTSILPAEPKTLNLLSSENVIFQWFWLFFISLILWKKVCFLFFALMSIFFPPAHYIHMYDYWVFSEIISFIYSMRELRRSSWFSCILKSMVHGTALYYYLYNC